MPSASSPSIVVAIAIAIAIAASGCAGEGARSDDAGVRDADRPMDAEARDAGTTDARLDARTGDGGTDADVDGGTALGRTIDLPTAPLPPDPMPLPSWVRSTDRDGLMIATVATGPFSPDFGTCEPWAGGGPMPCAPWPRGARATCTEDFEHFPGGGACEQVGSTCLASGWGPAPPAATTTLYVDASAPAGGTGSMASPYRSLAAALASAPATGTVVLVLKRGTYTGPFVLPANVTLYGACAQTVVTNPSGDAIVSGNGSAIRNLTVRDADRGVVVPSGAAATLDGVIVERTRIGVAVEGGALSATKLAVRASRAVTEPRGVLVDAAGSASLRGTVVHDIAGFGIAVLGGASVTLREVSVHSSDAAGIRAIDATLTAEGLVVEDVASAITAQASTLTIERAVLRDLGFQALGHTSAVSTAVRRTLVDGARGWGLALEGDSAVRDTIIRHVYRATGAADSLGAHGIGVRIVGGVHALDRVHVGRTDANGLVVWGGATATLRHVNAISAAIGIHVTDGSRLSLENGLILNVRGAGILVGSCLDATCADATDIARAGPGTVATLTDVLVEYVGPLPSGPLAGHGVLVTGSATAALTRVDVSTVDGTKIVVGDAAVGLAALAPLPPSSVSLADIHLWRPGGGILASDGASVTGARVVIAGTTSSAIDSRATVDLDDVVVGDVGGAGAAVVTSGDGTVELDRARILRCIRAIDASGGSVSITNASLVAAGTAVAQSGASLSLTRARISEAATGLVLAFDPGTTLSLIDVFAQMSAARAAGGAITLRSGATATIRALQIVADAEALLVAAEPDTRVSASDVSLECAGSTGACAGLAVTGSAAATVERLHVASARGLGAGAFGSPLDLVHARIADTTEALCGSGVCGVGLGAYDGARVAARDFDVVRAASVGAQLTSGSEMMLTGGTIRRLPIGVAMPPEAPIVVSDVTIADCPIEMSTEPTTAPNAPVLR